METRSRWSKTCSFPKTIRAKVLAEVLENTMEEENLVEVVRQSFLCFQQWRLFLNADISWLLCQDSESAPEGQVNDYEAKNQPRQQEARVVSLNNPDQVLVPQLWKHSQPIKSRLYKMDLGWWQKGKVKARSRILVWLVSMCSLQSSCWGGMGVIRETRWQHPCIESDQLGL